MKNKKLIIFGVIVIYFLLVFILPLLIFPGFLKETEIQRTERLENFSLQFKSEEKEQTLQNVFVWVDERYNPSKYKLFILLNRHFYTDVGGVLNKEGYMPCHVQSLVLKSLLINTNQFEEKDFEKKIIMTHWGTIHKYYLIQVENLTFKADPYYGILEKNLKKLFLNSYLFFLNSKNGFCP